MKYGANFIMTRVAWTSAAYVNTAATTLHSVTPFTYGEQQLETSAVTHLSQHSDGGGVALTH